MSDKIPPSLFWLIDKRARLAGEIIKTKKALSKVEHLVNKLRTLEQALEAIDSSLKLHEIQIDIDNIKPIKQHDNKMKFPGGFISRYVMEYLIARIDEPPIQKSEIVEFLIQKHLEYDDKLLPYGQASNAVSQALAREFRKGRVVKYHPSNTQRVGSWGLSKESIAIHSPPSFCDQTTYSTPSR